jgi:RNA polymerase sigma-70 factor (ECF subfamily)
MVNLVEINAPVKVVAGLMEIPIKSYSPGNEYLDWTDEQLIVQVKNGHQWALGVIYDRYGKRAYSLAYRMMRDAHSSEDVVQEAFLNVWRMAGSFANRRGSVQTWLLSVVHHKAVDALRRRRGQVPREVSLGLEVPPLQGADLWTEVANDLDREALDRALAQLPDEQRETIEMAYFEGYTQVEIAELILVPLGTVKGRVRLGMQKLRDFLLPRDPRGTGR